MAVCKMLTGGSIPIGSSAIDGTLSNSNKKVSFDWDFDAQSYIMIFYWTNDEHAIVYGTLDSDNIVFANSSSGWYLSGYTWSSLSGTTNRSSRHFDVTLSSYTFTRATLVPITNTLTP